MFVHTADRQTRSDTLGRPRTPGICRAHRNYLTMTERASGYSNTSWVSVTILHNPMLYCAHQLKFNPMQRSVGLLSLTPLLLLVFLLGQSAYAGACRLRDFRNRPY